MTDRGGRPREREWQAQVTELAQRYGWLHYHTYDSRRSRAGFPDLILIRGSRLIAVELKVGAAGLALDQEAWLAAFALVPGCEAYCWRPEQIEEVVSILAPRKQAKT